MESVQSWLVVFGILGVAIGLAAFVRGLVAYRREAVVASIASSTVDGLAAGEVRLTGVVQPVGVTLISALQSKSCVWYRSRVTEAGESDHVLLDEQRGVDFLLRDDTGTVRVVPKALRAQIDPAFDATTDLIGDDPVGLDRRVGATSMSVAAIDRDAAIADLLTVHPPTHSLDDTGYTSTVGFANFGSGLGAPFRSVTRARRHYSEQRIAPGDRITIVGVARTYAEVDPLGPDAAAGLDPTTFDDPTLVAELEEARATGELAGTAREAWGNAAIAGFGIGKPTERPVLDPRATPEEPATVAPATGQTNRSTATNPANPLATPSPESLVIAAGESTPLTAYAGTPTQAVAFDRDAFYRGLAGAVLAVCSAVLVAVAWRGL